MIIEYCPYGNLLDFLWKRRDIFDPMWMTASRNPDAQFSTTDLVISAFQVARAMEFLASRKVGFYYDFIVVFLVYIDTLFNRFV